MSPRSCRPDGITQHLIATPVHGRFLVRPPESDDCAGVLVGFHGYAENADEQLTRMVRLPGIGHWIVCSVQALHPFYTRSDGGIVASWMTSLDREKAIEDNLGYVRRIVDRLTRPGPGDRPVAFGGFSQGAAMAWRSACHHHGSSLVVAAGGEIPPELTAEQLSRPERILIARGAGDRHYTADRMKQDLERLARAGKTATVIETSGGHLWDEQLDEPVSRFLQETHLDGGKY